ncbi:MAG: helix-turn-helix transcriptional regulator [Ktedonobacteraceae bacterium]
MASNKQRKPNTRLRWQRNKKGWSLRKVADLIYDLSIKGGEGCGITGNLVSRWERGEIMPSPFYREKLCRVYELTAQELGFFNEEPAISATPAEASLTTENATPPPTADSLEDVQIVDAEYVEVVDPTVVDKKVCEVPVTPSQRSALSMEAGAIIGTAGDLESLWADDLLVIYARGIAACQDLYFIGSPRQVEAILPLYCNQTALLARQPSPLQQAAARLASQAQQLACELLTDREDFGAAEQAGRQAFLYAQLAGDVNLQVASLIGLANLGFHRKLSTAALQAYKHAVSLLNDRVTPLLKGRTYAGIAEVYAMRGQFQEAMRAMGLAYEHYPLRPEGDPSYNYLRASRYSLYVFGDAQSRLFLSQPKEAEKALIAMERETNDPQMEPVSKLDLLYYQAEVQIQQGELEPGSNILTEGAALAKALGSRLYFNKLAASYHDLQTRWPRESLVVALEEVFQPW